MSRSRLELLPLLTALAVGTPLAADDVRVEGLVEATAGFRFPDGSLQTRAFGEEQNRIVVAKSGGDHTTVQAAIDAVTAAGDAAEDNRYLVEIGPGAYNEQVTLIPFVDVRGSGIDTTTISFGGSATENTGTLVCANDATVSHLTIENSGGADFAIAAYCSSTSPRLSHVQLEAFGATDSAIALLALGSTSVTLRDSRVIVDGTASATPKGLDVRSNSNETVVVRRTEISVDGGSTLATGVENGAGQLHLIDTRIEVASTVAARAIGGQSSSGVTLAQGVTAQASAPTAKGTDTGQGDLTIRHSTIVASGATSSIGLYNDFETASYSWVVTNSRISGPTATVSVGLTGTVSIAFSQLDGGAISGTGAAGVDCVAVYDETYTTSASTCL